jgi:hypothetical protein
VLASHFSSSPNAIAQGLHGFTSRLLAPVVTPRVRVVIQECFKGIAKVFIGDAMEGKKIGKAKHAKAHLLVNARGRYSPVSPTPVRG